MATEAPTPQRQGPPGTPGAPPGPSPPRLGPWWAVLLLALAVNALLMRAVRRDDAAVSIPYSLFKAQVEAGNVKRVVGIGDEIRGRFETPVSVPAPAGAEEPLPEKPSTEKPPFRLPDWLGGGEAKEPRNTREFSTTRPAFADPGLEALLQQKGVVVDAKSPEGSSWLNLLIGFGPTLLLIAAFVWMMRRASAAGGGAFGLGRSRAKRYSPEQSRITFDDVAGIDEAENELIEIVDFLKNPAKYTRLGGTMPKGVLLVGAPGTGKTLLARAIAGEAGVPFFSLSAAEFVEMIVGVGAARVRDLFQQARQAAPAIVFVDELDAIGRSRGSGPALGGHDEREQTLNQILTEMDGFDSREGVIVLAATNRADVLDAALLRPGRFDRRIVVQRPDRAGRAAILAVHTRKVPLAPDVSLERLAAETPGLVGAELKNLVNEAALRAARKGASGVRTEDFDEALQKVTLGPARNVLLNPADRERTAYHEAGHALLGLLVPGSDPVRRVSIVPRGMALGATWQLPGDDRTSFDERSLRARLTSALGGRAAEQLVYGVVTSGAESDLMQVTALARNMVTRWGMSEKLGPVSFASPQDEGLPAAFQHRAYSEATAQTIDAEVRRILEECEGDANRVLSTNRGRLDALAQALLASESLDESEIRKAAGIPEPTEPAAVRAAL